MRVMIATHMHPAVQEALFQEVQETHGNRMSAESRSVKCAFPTDCHLTIIHPRLCLMVMSDALWDVMGLDPSQTFGCFGPSVIS